MLTLGFDTSNYATSLAVFDTAAGEVVCDRKRFLPVRAGHMGLRQSDAVFHHTAALPNILSELAQNVPLDEVAVVGVSAKPRPIEASYMPCFLTGVSAATAFSVARGLPLVKTTHQQGHIAAALFAARLPLTEPALVFHVSGGTTDLLLYSADGSVQMLGTSNDLYAGQAVDRLGVTLGYDFPAGAQVSAQALLCDEKIRPKVSVKGLNCSLSGLENQYRKLLETGKNTEYVCKYCLIYIAETLWKMTETAIKMYPKMPVVFAGGVMSSDIIRNEMISRIPTAKFVPAKYASDNAIGVAILAAREVGAWPTTSV